MARGLNLSLKTVANVDLALFKPRVALKPGDELVLEPASALDRPLLTIAPELLSKHSCTESLELKLSFGRSMTCGVLPCLACLSGTR